MELYHHNINDHYKRPRYKGVLSGSFVSRIGENKSCGDVIKINMKILEGIIVEISFEGSGCVISQATASMLVEKLHGSSVEVLKKMNKKDILGLLGIDLGPTRLKCALLPLEVAQSVVKEYDIGA